MILNLFPAYRKLQVEVASLRDDSDTLEVTLISERQASAALIAAFEARIAATESALQRERELYEQARTERDEYQKLYVAKCEYIVITEHKPPFTITDHQEPRPITSDRVTIADINAKHQQQSDAAFLDYLQTHPEDAIKFADLYS